MWQKEKGPTGNSSTGLISSHPFAPRPRWKDGETSHQCCGRNQSPRGCDEIRPVLEFCHMSFDSLVGTDLSRPRHERSNVRVHCSFADTPIIGLYRFTTICATGAAIVKTMVAIRSGRLTVCTININCGGASNTKK